VKGSCGWPARRVKKPKKMKSGGYSQREKHGMQSKYRGS